MWPLPASTRSLTFTELNARRHEAAMLSDLSLALTEEQRFGNARAIWEPALKLFIVLGADDDVDRVRRALVGLRD